MSNDGSTRSSRSRPGLNRGSGFSTRDFNVIDQSVNLMNMGVEETGPMASGATGDAGGGGGGGGGLSGLFRASRDSKKLSRFDYEYGDADAMNPADAEEYIDGKRRRHFGWTFYGPLELLGLLKCRQKPGAKTILTMAMAVTAFLLVFSSFHSLEEEMEEDPDGNWSQNNSKNNIGSQHDGYVATNTAANDNIVLEDHYTKKRFDEIKQRILDTSLTPPELFDTKPPTPQQSALDWLVFEDAAFLPFDHVALPDRYGLAVLYFMSNPNAATGGTNSWKKSDSWLTDKGICVWHGIECVPREQDAVKHNDYEPFTKTYDDNANVVAITLESNNMKGSIPGELGTAFPELLTIDFVDNRLTGSLPVVLRGAPKLRDLLLSHNLLVGTIPPEYTALQHLHRLGLSNNRLEGPVWQPEWSTSLTKLRYFAVSQNGLTGSIPDFTRMIRMTGLFLDGNLLVGSLPTTMASMTALMDLRLSDNQLTGSIQPLEKLQNLESIELANNRFTGQIPDMFDQLFRLHVLNLPNNKFEGPIPGTLTHLQTLRMLNLDSNKLDGTLPGGLGLLTDIISISLKDNQFGGTIPTILGRLDDIKTLTLNGNKLTGTIPSELGSCFRLETLHLQNNQLTGAIPITLGKLTGLSALHLEANGFKSIQMPPEVCALTEEEDLSILVSDCHKAVQCDCCTECL